jgi:putative AdoMet-dependent methyltransferase
MTEDPKRQNLFNNWAGIYNLDVHQETFPFIGYQDVLSTMVDLANIKPDHVVLDLGVGTGNLARMIPVPSKQVWGIDFSEKMLETAGVALPGAHLYQVDLLSEVWPEAIRGPFDRILSGYTLHEFPDETKQSLLLKLRCDYLKEGGIIAIGDISFPDRSAFNQGHQRFKGLWDEDEYYWCAEPMTNLLEASGFSVKYRQVSVCAGVYIFQGNTNG